MRTVALPKPLSKDVCDLFTFLLTVNREQNVNAILRVAGGWVRDTLLGIPSNDIDIALETPEEARKEGCHITGEVFASCIAAYQKRLQAESCEQAADATGSPPLKPSTVSVIKANPDKSKHIETAQITVMGVPLEFCHLRHDEYSSTSRIPEVRPGTPLEDAMRRDFTVNALFYNLHTQLVEDYTTGLADMERKLLRTPLAPRETFLDDPLRLFRGIRFAGQLGYCIDDAVMICARDEELVTMIREKVSRERYGIEVKKMLSGRYPAFPCRLLIDTGLMFNTILQEAYYKKGKGKNATMDIEALVPVVVPGEESAVRPSLEAWSQEALPVFLEQCAIGPGTHERVVVSLYCVVVTLYCGGCKSLSPAYTAVERPMDRLTALVSSGIKLPGTTAEGVFRMLDATQVLLGMQDDLVALLSGSDGDAPIQGPLRDAFYDALCSLNNKNVPPQAAVVCLATAALMRPAPQGVRPGIDLALHIKGAIAAAAATLNAAPALVAAPNCPLPVTGAELPALINVPKNQTAHYLQLLRRYCLHRPDATKDEAVVFLKSQAQAAAAAASVAAMK